MLKVFLAGLALVSTTAAYAETRTGPYVGVAATVDSPNVKIGGVDGIGSTGVGASAFAGYNIALGNRFFIAPEANIDLNTVDGHLTSGDSVLAIKPKWGWGVGARVGYDVTDSTAAYLRAGYARNQVKIVDDGVSDKSWGDGIRVGGGVETQIAPHASFRLEYNYVNYEQGVTNNQGLLGIVYKF